MNVSNRELLRNYKSIRTKLLSGEVDVIEVDQKNGVIIRLSVHKKESPAQRMLDFAKKNPLKNITRPDLDLFDER